MELVLIRHFPTPGNGKRQYIGSTDEELDQLRIPELLPVYPDVEQVVCSPMKRCIQTAELLYPGRKMLVWDEFREMDFGDYEGKTFEELKSEPAYQAWLE
ncbi:MAG: histidine phosphatase family protein, partial [Lachnospiraceae bacterium]|nr:histidine phosphatase family protein [Lachnospiraceae bacterium]